MKASVLKGVAAVALAEALVAGCANQGGGMGNVMQTDAGKGALSGATCALIGGLVDHADPAVGILTATGNPRSTWEDGRAELVIHPVISG